MRAYGAGKWCDPARARHRSHCARGYGTQVNSALRSTDALGCRYQNMCVRVLRCKSKRSAGEKRTVLEKFDQSLRQIKVRRLPKSLCWDLLGA